MYYTVLYYTVLYCTVLYLLKYSRIKHLIYVLHTNGTVEKFINESGLYMSTVQHSIDSTVQYGSRGLGWCFNAIHLPVPFLCILAFLGFFTIYQTLDRNN